MTEKNFIGRDHELDVLLNIASEAADGSAGSVFLSGRRGVGKTKLLSHVYDRLFHQGEGVVPFIHTMKTAYVSVEMFAEGYLCDFILQTIAFLEKDASIIDAGVYSFDEIKRLAGKSEAQWAVDMMDDYSRSVEKSRPVNLFLSAISAPLRSFRHTGLPVLVMLDDFHKMRKFCELNDGQINRDFWVLYEKSALSPHTPHVFSGLDAELHDMFFEKSSFGNILEVLELPGLDRENSVKLFTRLCEKYGLKIDLDLPGFMGIFAGSPFYIRNFLQAARQAGRNISEDEFWLIYLNEVTRGKTYKYWTSLLKTYVSQFELRKPSLRFLYHLCDNDADIFFSNPTDLLSVEQEKFEHILDLLHVSGAVESGFSEMRLAEDEIMTDVIKGLYHREILKDTFGKIKDVIIGAKYQRVQRRTPSFDVTIPAEPKAELAAVRSLEQIAEHFSLPSDIAGQLQLALIELFTGPLSSDKRPALDCHVGFKLKERKFYIEITVEKSGITLPNEETTLVRSYVDEMNVESTLNGTRITLIKSLGGGSAGEE